MNVLLAFLACRRCPHHLEESGPSFWSCILDSSGCTMLSIPGFSLELNLRAEKELMEHCRTGLRQEPHPRPGVAKIPALNKVLDSELTTVSG